MKELRDQKASAQPMPTAEEVLHATLTQDGETVTLDADQIAAICAVLPQLRTQEIVRNLYVKEANAESISKRITEISSGKNEAIRLGERFDAK